jgi:hypothetical protein
MKPKHKFVWPILVFRTMKPLPNSSNGFNPYFRLSIPKLQPVNIILVLLDSF